MSNFFNHLLDLTCGQVIAISLLINALMFGAWLMAALSTATPQAGEIELKADQLLQLRNERI